MADLTKNYLTNLALTVDNATGRLLVDDGGGGGSGGAGGGPATIADGADVAQGGTTDAAVITDANGTLNAHMRGLIALWLTGLKASSAVIGKVGIDQTTPGTTNAVVSGGNVASGAADSGNPIKVAGKYNSTLPTFTNGQRADLQVDANGLLRVLSAVSDGANVAQGAQADGLAGIDLTQPWSQIAIDKATLDRLRQTLTVDDADTQLALALLQAAIGSTTDAAVAGNLAGTLIGHARQLNKLTTLFTDQANSRINVALATALDKVNDEVAAVMPQCTLVEGALASTAATSVIAAPAAGSHLEIYRIETQATADGSNTVTWREGSGGSDKWSTLVTLTKDIVSRRLNGSWHLATATALYIKASTTTGLHYAVEYRSVLDSARA